MEKLNATVFFRDLAESDEFHVESAKLDFALELKRVMERTNLSNAQLAERLGVSRPMVSKLLRGDANLTIETMVKAARNAGGRLFLKVIPEGSVAKMFELAKCGEQIVRAHEGARAHSLRDKDVWTFAANDLDTNEAQPLAA